MKKLQLLTLILLSTTIGSFASETNKKYPSRQISIGDKKETKETTENNSIKDEELDEELLEAAAHNNVAKIKELIAKGASIEAQNEEDAGARPLHLAALDGACTDDTEAIKFLINKGADINAEDYEGATVLVYAISNDRTRNIRLLLGMPQLKTEINSEMKIKLDEHPNTKQLISNRIFGQKQFFQAIKENNYKKVEALINQLKDLHLYDYEIDDSKEKVLWNNPLHCALATYKKIVLEQTLSTQIETKKTAEQTTKNTKTAIDSCKNIITLISSKNPELWYTPNSMGIMPLQRLFTEKELLKDIIGILPEHVQITLKDTQTKHNELQKYVHTDISFLIQEYAHSNEEEIEQNRSQLLIAAAQNKKIIELTAQYETLGLTQDEIYQIAALDAGERKEKAERSQAYDELMSEERPSLTPNKNSKKNKKQKAKKKQKKIQASLSISQPSLSGSTIWLSPSTDQTLTSNSSLHTTSVSNNNVAEWNPIISSFSQYLKSNPFKGNIKLPGTGLTITMHAGFRIMKKAETDALKQENPDWVDATGKAIPDGRGISIERIKRLLNSNATGVDHCNKETKEKSLLFTDGALVVATDVEKKRILTVYERAINSSPTSSSSSSSSSSSQPSSSSRSR